VLSLSASEIPTSDEGIRALSQQFRQRLLCKICLSEAASIIYLPCAHLSKSLSSYTVPSHTIQYPHILYSTLTYYTVPSYTIQYPHILYSTLIYYTVSSYTIQYPHILYSILIHYTVSSYTIQYPHIPYSTLTHYTVPSYTIHTRIVVSCSECSAAMTACPVCRQDIKGTITVNYSAISV